MPIQEMKEILQGQGHIFQEIYFESSQIYQLTLMYCLEHTNNDILLNLLFQNIYKVIVLVDNLHQ